MPMRGATTSKIFWKAVVVFTLNINESVSPYCKCRYEQDVHDQDPKKREKKSNPTTKQLASAYLSWFGGKILVISD
jgi:hypothetical protein